MFMANNTNINVKIDHPSDRAYREAYDTDFVLWAEETARLLEQRRFEEVDLENLVEEVLDLARRNKDALESHLSRLLMHLLKWQFQPEKRCRSWLGTIREARKQIRKIESRFPSLKNHRDLKLADCYEEARDDAAFETSIALETFPLECPFSIEEILDPNFPVDPFSGEFDES